MVQSTVTHSSSVVLTLRNNLEYLELSHKGARLELRLQGAHITSYKPFGGTELLWVSSIAHLQQGKAIRGGIPICWPWFGAHWISPEQGPQHGFARASEFKVISQHANEDRACVVLGLVSAPKPYDTVAMQVEIELSDQLSVQVRTTNKGKEPIEIGAALHTYFQISDTNQVNIPELKDLQYKDKTQDFEKFTQSDSIEINQEIDRVYLDPPKKVNLLDLGLERRIEINTWGNTDLVVWNPWVVNAKSMTDFDNEGYQSMLCIEPANALGNRVLLNPEEEHLLGKSICLVDASDNNYIGVTI